MSMQREERIYFNYKRFDFGVPLEDIFTPIDIHPRLKYLLEQAYKKSKKYYFNIDQLLRGVQVPLEECLQLKEIIIFQVHYETYHYEKPETYFWLIRHFLGLLPISLLPKYASGFIFDWEGLSKHCQRIMRCNRRNQDKKTFLDYRIANSLNCLPPEHLVMFNILAIFIYKVSQNFVKPSKLERKVLLSLVKYYCGAIFTRPYRPGYEDHRDNKMIHFLLYVTIRWHKIQRYLERRKDFRFIRSSWQELELFTTKSAFIQQQYPCVQCKKYLKDVYSQTDNDQCETSARAFKLESVQENILGNLDEAQNQNISKENIHLTLEKDFCVTTELKEMSKNQQNVISASPFNCVDDEKSNMEVDRDYISFPSSLDTSNQVGWRDVIEETVATVKKVDEYIYDDYETFRKEEYNQISGSGEKSTKFNEMLKTVWVESTPKKSCCHQNEVNTREACLPEYNQTYLKYPDVFTESNEWHKGIVCVTDNFKNTEGIYPAISRSYNNSNEFLCNSGLKELSESKNKGNKNKTNFNLKRFKMKLHFLRIFSSNTTANSSSIFNKASNVKYKKINDMKSFTL